VTNLTFVLVHGSWHGGWCWRFVADILVASGHRVYAPTLTGLGERSHLMNREVNLTTHITDVVNVFRWEDIGQAVLCAHSYGGWPVSGAVEHVERQVSSLVFVDAHIPRHGTRGIDRSHHQREILLARDRGEWSVPPPPEARFCKTEAGRKWVDSKMTAQPIGVSLEPISLTGARDRIAKKTYLRATGFPSTTFDDYYHQAKDEGWRTDEIDCGHDIMVDEPEWLAKMLVESA